MSLGESAGYALDEGWSRCLKEARTFQLRQSSGDRVLNYRKPWSQKGTFLTLATERARAALEISCELPTSSYWGDTA